MGVIVKVLISCSTLDSDILVYRESWWHCSATRVSSWLESIFGDERRF
jgi:hypothetical protein